MTLTSGQALPTILGREGSWRQQQFLYVRIYLTCHGVANPLLSFLAYVSSLHINKRYHFAHFLSAVNIFKAHTMFV